MKVLILSGLILLSAAVSEAAGREEASQICRGMIMSRDTQSCMEKLTKYDHFDAGAINICRNIMASSSQLECVDNIGNKVYEKYEISSCRDMISDRDTNNCLKRLGRVANVMPGYPGQNYGCISKRELQRELSRLERLVQYNDNGRALQVIRRLQYDVSCN